MSELETIKVPDIGDVEEVEIIEVLVSEGDTVAAEDSLITVESDKASMEIPAPKPGTITAMLVRTSDKVSAGSDILVLDVAPEAVAVGGSAAERAEAVPDGASDHAAVAPDGASAAADAAPGSGVDTATTAAGSGAAAAEVSAIAAGVTAATAAVSPGEIATAPHSSEPEDERYELVVIGSGPGGYTAAFRAADLGRKVLLIERFPSLGGVCLNVGCIPSKALLHTAAVIEEAGSMAAHGVSFGQPEIDIDKLRGFKESVVGKLTGGLAGLAKQRKVTVMHGVAEFASASRIKVTLTGDSEAARHPTGSEKMIGFDQAIIAVGSESVRIPGFPYDDERLMDSTGALELADIPERLLVIGGGIIGLEMGCVYAGLGSRITVVELSEGLMPGADRDLVKPLQKRLERQFENIFTGAKVAGIEATDAGLEVTFEGGKAPASDTFDRVLLAVGRSPNGSKINAAAAGVKVDERGFIPVDSQQRTNVPHIFAIGDVVGQPMLAHKATHEAKTAAEVASGEKSWFDARTIPSVAYTDPEVAWMGLTETQAKADGIAYAKGQFPWAASGRSLSLDRSDGMTKVLYDPETHRILGYGIVGPNAGELIAEAVLALEMGAELGDIALTVHPHPTLSETLNFAAEVAEGTCTDIYAPKRGRK